jgi:hypothetical protein
MTQGDKPSLLLVAPRGGGTPHLVSGALAGTEGGVGGTLAAVNLKLAWEMCSSWCKLVVAVSQLWEGGRESAGWWWWDAGFAPTRACGGAHALATAVAASLMRVWRVN